MSNINVHRTWRQQFKDLWGRQAANNVPEMDEVQQEADLLNRDILVRELDIIDKQHKINAQRAKHEFILKWLSNGRTYE